MKKLMLAVATVAISSAALADTGFYAGGNLGQSRISMPNYTDTVIQQFGANPATVDRSLLSFNAKEDKSHINYKFYGGYRYSENLAVEMGFVHLGKFKSDFTADYDGVNGPAGRGSAKSTSYGVFVDALGIVPASDSVDLFGRAGLALARTKVSASGFSCDNSTLGACTAATADDTSRQSASKTRVLPKVGVGADVSLTDTVSVRFEYERYFNVGGSKSIMFKEDINSFSVGLTSRF